MTSRLIGDVNDYIENEVACILPTKISNDPLLEEDRQVVVNLNDCLACSGCITSAESVLVEEQSYKALKAYLLNRKDKDLPMAVTISPSTISALQSITSLSRRQVWGRINYYFTNIKNFSFLIDASYGSEICLYFAKEEYENNPKSKTLFTSECPGWICYVEKRHPELIDQLSRVPSAQQVIGFLLKRGFLKGNDCYHLAIMSCYDKKLEASRSEYSSTQNRDVDLVISTDEFLSLLKDEGLEFETLLENDCFKVPFGSVNFSKRSNLSQGGGYMNRMMINSKIIEEKKIRNSSDYVEYTLNLIDGRTIKMAKIYGFKNIQTFLQRSKRLPSSYYCYVEIMACPGACLFGGGQPPLPNVNRDEWEELWINDIDIDDNIDDNINDMDKAILFLKENNLMNCKYNTTIAQRVNPILKVQW